MINDFILVVNAEYHIDGFGDADLLLRLLNKSPLIILYEPFNVLFNLVC